MPLAIMASLSDYFEISENFLLFRKNADIPKKCHIEPKIYV